MDSKYIIEMVDIKKEFPNILANDNVTLKLKKGEIHALLGENGAGKSTLMSILFGLYQPDCGEIFKNGKKVIINNPNDANRLGIGMVHQHFKLVEVFTVLENIILGVEDSKYGLISKKEAREKVMSLCKKYKFNLNLDSKIENITVGQQQKVEILKMLYRNNEILILDEPTAVLTPQEIEELMLIIRQLASEGKSILFITHKLNEIMNVCDRVTILRKGQWINTLDVLETNIYELAEMMVGRKISLDIIKDKSLKGEPVLKVRNLIIENKYLKKNVVSNVSFNVCSNEIVCIAGIDGNGQSELIYGITGIEKIKSGKIFLENKEITRLSVKERNSLGISHIVEDRHKYGLVLDYSLKENLVLKKHTEPQFQKYGFIRKNNVNQYSKMLLEKYDIRASNETETVARSMSGGNQQKAIVAREIEKDHKLLIAVCPTRGLDIGAINYIHKQIIKQRDMGKAILLVSFELEEVMDLADRILVIYEGKIVGEFNPKETNYNELGLYMSGAKGERNV